MYDKQRLKSAWSNLLRPLFVPLENRGVTPTHITLTGVLLIMSGCLLLLQGYTYYALPAFIAGGLCDTLDGAYARASGQVTRFGGFLDSVVDRYNEFTLVGCVLYLYRSDPFFYYWGFLMFSGIALMSYTRALYEKNGFQCPGNPFEYFERGIYFLCFFAWGRLDLWLVLVALGTHLSIVYRLYAFKRLAI